MSARTAQLATALPQKAKLEAIGKIEALVRSGAWFDLDIPTAARLQLEILGHLRTALERCHRADQVIAAHTREAEASLAAMARWMQVHGIGTDRQH